VSFIDITIFGVQMPKRKLDPLPAAAFQILLSLAEGDLHGYAIMRQVEEQTAGKVRLGPGTLYSSIQALLEQGFIEEVERADGADAPQVQRERRRLYRLSTSGRKVARTEAEKLADILRIARAKKILRGEYV
jgi:DNA-binding PadR family transcriptional regulator